MWGVTSSLFSLVRFLMAALSSFIFKTFYFPWFLQDWFFVTGFLTFEYAMPQFSSVAQLCPTLYNTMDCSVPGCPVHHQLPEFAQIHVHCIGDAIQPSHPLPPPSPPAFNLSQLQGLLKWVSSLHPVAKVLEFQLQHQSFQWIFRIDFL